ncbi:F0F1 ATP synthase subunit alpha [Candidatus Hepatobacter penaei]|uniref:F0F1 ATP synthase subunit alpha n=1 Tax=Candidatus Hepatobacter penaei TaxID=1274402 RepID=UPI0004F24BBC|nr:F0F1 ATP synthase subunit alpha [Candidatus Hepatobacter penaei]TGW14685.1 F0F1 ATP synthase subunit alpha [bacterium NHP-B]
MTLSSSEALSVLQDHIKHFDHMTETREVGRVLSLSDGIATVWGLDGVKYGERVILGDNVQGIALSLHAETTGIVLLGSGQNLQEGDLAKRTGEMVEAPVGMGILGRVLDGLGRPIDGNGPLTDVSTAYIDAKAPGIIERESVSTPLQTGVKAIDALVPIGRGQRELIIGDRQTGKTTLAIDAILNQKKAFDAGDENNQVHCIYVGIGQKQSTIAHLVQVLKEKGAMAYTTVVAANASDPASLQYLVPYVGCTMGEYFRDRSKHALIIYDDLSKHAVAYREMSLLLKRPPGREAYPGDVFYLHARLLERAGKMSADAGGGSLTALPIIETQAGDISAYIPTNVISITDGQIFLESKLFNEGLRPAINVGTSVSRVGSAAQRKAMKQVAGKIKLELAQYKEMQAFSQLSSDLDSTSKQLLTRGRALTLLLKQPPYSPLSMAEQVVLLFAGTRGYLDDLHEDAFIRFSDEFLAALREDKSLILTSIEKDAALSAAVEKKLNTFLVTFMERFV